MYESTKTLLAVRGLLRDLSFTVHKTAVLTDSAATIRTLHNPVSTRYKFLGIYIHFVKELVTRMGLEIHHLNRDQNAADLLTKQSRTHEFQRLLELALPPFSWKHVRTSPQTMGGASQIIGQQQNTVQSDTAQKKGSQKIAVGKRKLTSKIQSRKTEVKRHQRNYLHKPVF